MRLLTAALLLVSGACGSSGQRGASADGGSTAHDATPATGDGPPSGAEAGGSDGASGLPVSITLTPVDLVLSPASSIALRAEARDKTGTVVAADLTWHSSDESIATVADGLVTGVTAGQAQITASIAGVTSGPAAVTVAVGRTTSDLLASAVTAGEITANQAVVYEVFALFGDPRLPEKYRMPPTGTSLRHDLLMLDVADRYDTLGPDEQAAIAQYMIPPAYQLASAGAAPPPDSGVQALLRPNCILSPGWTSIATDHFRIWWNSTEVAAAPLAGIAPEVAMDAEYAYRQLVTTMGFRAPLSDSGLGCDGGDGLLDIYLLDDPDALSGLDAITYASTDSGGTSSAFIELSPVFVTEPRPIGKPSVQLRNAIAHELMHAIQAAYDGAMIPSYLWVDEATATWATEAVYPADGNGKIFANGFVSRIKKPLFYPNDTCSSIFSSPACSDDPYADTKMYGAYLFFQYLTRAVSPDAVKRLFESAHLSSDSLAALELTLTFLSNRGLTDVWGDFALAMWNHHEVAKTSVLDQGFVTSPVPVSNMLMVDAAGPALAVTAPTARQPGATLATDFNLNELSVVYDDYTFADGVSSLVFYNGFSQQLTTIPYAVDSGTSPLRDAGLVFASYDSPPANLTKGRRVWALERIGGTWTIDDWTGRAFVPLCFDKQSERLEELILVFSNGNYTETRTSDFEANAVGPVGDRKSTLVGSPVPCWKYQGSAAAHLGYNDGTDSFDVTNNFAATFVGTPKIAPVTLPEGTGTVLAGWTFTADAPTVSVTSVASTNLGTCHDPPAFGSRVTDASFFNIPAAFDSLLPIPGGPGDLAYAGSGTAQQWQDLRCVGGLRNLPAVAMFDFDLGLSTFQKIDLAGRRLIAPAAPMNEAPPYDNGDYANPGAVENTWCFSALTEGGPAPAACP